MSEANVLSALRFGGSDFRLAVTDQERVQGLAMELRAMEAYLADLSNREALIARAIAETQGAEDSLRALSTQPISDSLLHVGAGVFVRTTAPPAERVLVSVGANVAMEKSKTDALAFLGARIQELEKAGITIRRERSDLAGRIEATRAEVTRLVEHRRSG